jgi:hypothetical protein
MRFAPALRKFTFTTHVSSSVAWMGAVLVFLALAAIALVSEDEGTVRGAYLVMAPAAWLVLVPLAHASLLTGIALSLGTPWGLFRHYWVVLKLGITALCTVVLVIYMGTFQQMAGVAADPVIEMGLVRNPSPLLHSALALVLLVTATVLAVYKPFGMTAHGLRQQGSLQSLPNRRVVAARNETRNRVFLVLVVAGIVGLLLIVTHLIRGGLHSNCRSWTNAIAPLRRSAKPSDPQTAVPFTLMGSSETPRRYFGRRGSSAELTYVIVHGPMPWSCTTVSPLVQTKCFISAGQCPNVPAGIARVAV